MAQVGRRAMEEGGENLPALRTVFLKPRGGGRTVHTGGGSPGRLWLGSLPPAENGWEGGKVTWSVAACHGPGPQAGLTPSQMGWGDSHHDALLKLN